MSGAPLVVVVLVLLGVATGRPLCDEGSYQYVATDTVWSAQDFAPRLVDRNNTYIIKPLPLRGDSSGVFTSLGGNGSLVAAAYFNISDLCPGDSYAVWFTFSKPLPGIAFYTPDCFDGCEMPCPSDAGFAQSATAGAGFRAWSTTQGVYRHSNGHYMYAMTATYVGAPVRGPAPVVVSIRTDPCDPDCAASPKVLVAPPTSPPPWVPYPNHALGWFMKSRSDPLPISIPI